MVVGQIIVTTDTVYVTVNKGGTVEKINAPKHWWRRLQLALTAQVKPLSLQDVRRFCSQHSGLVMSKRIW